MREHAENCTKISESCIVDTEAAKDGNKCIACHFYADDAFKSREECDEQIKLDSLVLEYFVIHYKDYLVNIYNTRNTNEECERFRNVDDPVTHLKWDYFTAFIEHNVSVEICNLIIKHTDIKDIKFVVFVLLTIFNRSMIDKYYGLNDTYPDYVELYKKTRHLDELFVEDFPNDYTLDEVYNSLLDNSQPQE